MPEETAVSISTVRACSSPISPLEWQEKLSARVEITLPAQSVNIVDLQAQVHSTAFLRWEFQAKEDSIITLKTTYSEGYELEPRDYPFFRLKGNRLDAENGQIIGPFDQIELELPKDQLVTYEPFWFRTFRLIRMEIKIGSSPVDLVSFTATQTNYPMAVRADWHEKDDTESRQIWEVSIRTMRNCMFDGYSDCPFYEQLQ